MQRSIRMTQALPSAFLQKHHKISLATPSWPEPSGGLTFHLAWKFNFNCQQKIYMTTTSRFRSRLLSQARRWSRTNRSKLHPVSPARGGTRFGAAPRAPTRFTNRARMPPVTGFTAGWVPLRRIRKATWLSAIAWLMGQASSEASATLADWRQIRWAHCRRARARSLVLRGADDDKLALGRLHIDEYRPSRRLHLLVRERVLHAGRPAIVHDRLANPGRQLQASRLPIAQASI